MIFRTSAGRRRAPPQGSVVTATILISEPHRGQGGGLSLSASWPLPPYGSLSYTFPMSRAQAGRQAVCDTVAGVVALACGDINSSWDCFHPRGAARAM